MNQAHPPVSTKVRDRQKVVLWTLIGVLSFALYWTGGRIGAMPFSERAILFDAETDSVYHVELTPELGFGSRRDMMLGFSWRNKRVITYVNERAHLHTALGAHEATMARLQSDPQSWADSVMAVTDTATHEEWTPGPIESGIFMFRGVTPADSATPPALVEALALPPRISDDVVPIWFTLVSQFIADAPPSRFENTVVPKGYLIRGDAARRFHDAGLQPP